ncbi:MAG: hypothetical protein L6V93_16960 [Clostridiales bacterium]|nr:MAG: hypothetical protein L6V93_16960 [Clostridiales bacterium]
MYFDNVLIYEPYDVYMTDIDAVNKTVKIVNDGSSAVTGNVFIALYDNDKNLLAAKRGKYRIERSGRRKSDGFSRRQYIRSH